MNYIEEYTQALNGLKYGEKTKFDVSFIISEPMKSACEIMNQRLNKSLPGKINMGEGSIIFPHISLFMGFVDNYDMLLNVFRKVKLYSQETPVFQIDFEKLYFKGVTPTSSQYLFLDPHQNDYLMKQKEIMNDYLKHIVHPIGWNMKDERAHITIGCYDTIPQDTGLLNHKNYQFPSCNISQVGISIAGNHGVCLGLLKVFDLIEKN